MNIKGHELAVEISGSGPAVLMVHGLGGTSNFYQVQADALQDNHTVIRFDSAGAGRSELAADISIESHADDLAAVAAALNARPRKTLGWRTPAEALDEALLSAQTGVATTS